MATFSKIETIGLITKYIVFERNSTFKIIDLNNIQLKIG